MTTAAIIFAVTYLVLGIQRVPRLHIGRPAGALLGAVAMVAFGVVSYAEARAAIDLDTILFLLGMMVVLAYLELSGFFEIVERSVIGWARSPRQLLGIVVASSGILAALFMNDTICLMFTPIILRVTRRLEVPPAPYLVALAMAANIGSACTIIGNPQNALIGVRSGMPFLGFAAVLAPISAAGLLVAWATLAVIYRREITGRTLIVPPPRQALPVSAWMLASSLACGFGMVVALALGASPPAAAITAGAGAILAGAARPRVALQKVDWSLLLLFGGLFVVMEGVERSGLASLVVSGIAGPFTTGTPAVIARLGAGVTVLSQAVSNVPAVLLFVKPVEALPAASATPLWLALAAFATLAGNLTIIASIANIIVFETAAREGVPIGFTDYLKAGFPVTLITFVLAWAWFSVWF